MEISSQQRAALEAAVADDPGAPAFAALAELERRAQRPAQSERIARDGLAHKPEDRDGRLVLALALIDQGRVDEARQTLARLAAEALARHVVAAPSGALSEAELDQAFDRAETDTDQLIDPDRVAEEALSHVDGTDLGVDEVSTDAALAPGSAFATATLADLLERQGDVQGAARIRQSLGSPPPAPPDAEPSMPIPERRSRVLATLERWLGNIRGERA